MPTAPATPCRVPGCPGLVRAGVCTRRDRHPPSPGVRGTTAARGYGERHRKWRALVLAEQPLCLGWPAGVHGAAPPPSQTADHIVSLRRWAHDPITSARLLSIARPNAETLDAWSIDNGQGLCAPCHGRKTVDESRTDEGRVES